MSPRPDRRKIPTNVISIRDGVATCEIQPCHSHLTDEQKLISLAAKMQIFSVYACTDTPMPRTIARPVKWSDYGDSLRWCIEQADFIFCGLVDCRQSSVERAKDVEKLRAQFAAEKRPERFQLTIITDEPFGISDYLRKHRPQVPYTLAMASSDKVLPVTVKKSRPQLTVISGGISAGKSMG